RRRPRPCRVLAALDLPARGAHLGERANPALRPGRGDARPDSPRARRARFPSRRCVVNRSGRVLMSVLAIVVWISSAGCGDDPSRVHASGIIEMDEIDVSSMVGGRVARMTVGEGDSVYVGDTLAVLDRDEVAADLRVQSAEAERATAQSHEVSKG